MIKKMVICLLSALTLAGLFAGSNVFAGFSYLDEDWDQANSNNWNWNNVSLNYRDNNWGLGYNRENGYWKNYDWNKDINWIRQRDEINNQIRFREFNQRLGFNHEDFYKFNDWMRRHDFRDFDDYNRYSGNKFKDWNDFNQYFGNRFNNYNDLSRMMRSHRFQNKDDFVVFLVVFVNFDNFNRYCNNNRFRNFDDFKNFTRNNNFGNFDDYNRYFGNRWDNYGSFNQTCGNRYNNFNDYWGSTRNRDYSDFGNFSNYMMYDR